MTGKKKKDSMENWRSIKANPNGGFDIDNGDRIETRRQINDPESWTSIRSPDTSARKVDPEEAIKKTGNR